MIAEAWAQAADSAGISPAAMERLVESSPVIVVLLSTIGLLVWRAWREDRKEMANELREEREARARMMEQMLAMGERSREAIQAVREAIQDLRHAIESRNRGPGAD
jgi:beta-phosphoglucomutase-like phosphatase (HAD superfamily)